MDPLRLSALGPVALNATQPVQPPPPPAAAPSAGQIGAQDLFQTLLQDQVQQAVQAAVLQADTGQTPFSLGLAQSATASLLAALNAPQASATATATPDATATAAATQVQGPAADTTTATSTAPAVSDAFQTGSTLEFALQTALRFGAGVAAQAAQAPLAPDLAAGLVRDPVAVLRQRNVQPHTGGPGPEAFARTQAVQAAQQAIRTYQTIPAAGETGQLDLTA